MKSRELFRELDKDPERRKAWKKIGPNCLLARDILRMRTNRGWSAAYLAKKAGVRHWQVLRWENAVGNPKLSHLKKLARAFGKEVRVRFVTGVEVKESLERSLVENADVWRALAHDDLTGGFSEAWVPGEE